MRVLLTLVALLAVGCAANPMGPSPPPDSYTVTVNLYVYGTNAHLATYRVTVPAGVESCIAPTYPGYRPIVPSVCGVVNSATEIWSFWMEAGDDTD